MKILWTIGDAVEAIEGGAKMVLTSHELERLTAYIIFESRGEAHGFFELFNEMMFPEEGPFTEIEAELDKFLGIHLELDSCNIAFSGGKWSKDPVILRVEEDLRAHPKEMGEKLHHLLGLIFERS